MANIMWIGLCIAQFCTLAAYVVVTAGAALLQKKANELTLFDGLNATDLEATQKAYNDVFQSTTYIVPYPQRPEYQFQYQWWIIEYELFIFLITLSITVFPTLIPRVRPVALTFMASALVLVMDNINGIFYLLRSDLAKTVYGEYRIQVAQAGLIMVGIANGMTIFFLGLYESDKAQPSDANVHVTNGQNKV